MEGDGQPDKQNNILPLSIKTSSNTSLWKVPRTPGLSLIIGHCCKNSNHLFILSPFSGPLPNYGNPALKSPSSFWCHADQALEKNKKKAKAKERKN